MLLKILKSNQSFNLILFPIIGIILWLKSLFFPSVYSFYPGEDQMVLFRSISLLTAQIPFLQVLITLIIVILIGFLLQNQNNQFAFIRIRTLLPSGYFVILMGGLIQLHYLHPIYFAALFVMFAINRMFNAFEKKSILSNAFDTGLLIGIGSLFYFNLLFIFPAFIIGIATINREFSWRELILFFWGLLLPWIFTFSYSLIIKNTDELFKVILQNFSTHNPILGNKWQINLFLGYQILLIIIASLNLLKFYDRKKVSSRKYFMSFFWIFVFSLATLLFVPSASEEMFLLISIPATYLISNFLVFNKNRFVGEIFFLIFIGLTVLMQII